MMSMIFPLFVATKLALKQRKLRFFDHSSSLSVLSVDISFPRDTFIVATLLFVLHVSAVWDLGVRW